MNGKGTSDQIFNLRQIIEMAREFNVPLLVCFVDYQKAFDTVKWHHLWQFLEEIGLPFHLIYLLKNLYESNVNTVRIDDRHSQPFQTRAGVRQGCIVIDPLQYIERINYEKIGGISVGGRKINNLRYADDTTLFAATDDELAELIQRVESASREVGLLLNKQKTKVMIVDRANSNHPDVNKIADCDVISKFIYLGALISNENGCNDEIRRRIEISRSAMTMLQKIWEEKGILNNTKQHFVKTLVFPIFLYGVETWSLLESERRRVDAFKMWVWRQMLRISYVKTALLGATINLRGQVG